MPPLFSALMSYKKYAFGFHEYIMAFIALGASLRLMRLRVSLFKKYLNIDSKPPKKREGVGGEK